MASKSKTYELALKIAGKVDSSLKKSCLAAAKDVEALSTSAQKVGKKAAKAMAAIGTAAATVAAASTKKAIEFESTMADVAKVVDGLRDENGAFTQSYYKMSDALLNMSKSIPMTADALGQIMASAGQAGIASEDLTAFTETAAKMGVAFDTTAEQAGEWMATWRTALNLSQTQVTALGDQLNYLGNTTSENALKLSEVVTRVGALGQTAGLSAGEVAALAASMPGVTAEISATGIKSMMIAMTAGASATSKQSAVLQQLGFTATEMANRMQTDAKGAIIDLLGAIKRLPEAEQTAALSQYFGKESVSSIAPLLKNLGYLQQQFDKVGDATAYSGSMEAEYAVRADTTANKLQLMQNKISALQVQIGNKILPYVNDALDELSANVLPEVSAELDVIVPNIINATKWLWDHRSAVVAVGVAIGGTVATFKGMKTAATVAQTLKSVSTVIGGVSKNCGALGKVFGLLNGKFAIIAAVIAVAAGAFVLLWNKSEKFRETITSVGQKLQPLLQALQSMAQMIFSKIAPQVKLLASLLVNGLEQAFLTLSPIVENIIGVFTGLINFITGVFSGNWKQAWQGVCDIFSNLLQGIVNVAKLPLNAIVGAINAVIGAINDCGITIPDWVPVLGGKKFSINLPQIPLLASGGIATGPTLAMIGEGGEPEAVLPLSKLAQLLDDWTNKPKPGGAGGGDSIVFSPVFNFYGGTPSRDEAIEAGRVSFAEFKRLYRRMKDEERRKQFSPA